MYRFIFIMVPGTIFPWRYFMHRIIATSLLVAPMIFPSAAIASDSATDATASTQAPRISTGVVAPRMVHSLNLDSLTGTFVQPLLDGAEIDVALQVDEKGNAKNVQVISPVNSFLDEQIETAVRQAHFRPAMLDNQPIPIDLDLKLVIQH